MSLFEPTAADFEPLPRQKKSEQITRPSLSYWQDAWARLKRNTRAIISLGIIVLLSIFTLIGPLLWSVNPASQNLNQISQAPSWAKSAVVIAPYQSWDGIQQDNFTSPDQILSSLPAPTNFRTADTPTTQRVRLSWDPVPGANGYNVYRNNRVPRDFNDLGLPLGSTYGNKLSYEDRLSLEPREYYYSLVPTDG